MLHSWGRPSFSVACAGPSIRALLATRSVDEAARVPDGDPRPPYRWMKEGTFDAAYRAALHFKLRQPQSPGNGVELPQRRLKRPRLGCGQTPRRIRLKCFQFWAYGHDATGLWQ